MFLLEGNKIASFVPSGFFRGKSRKKLLFIEKC